MSNAKKPPHGDNIFCDLCMYYVPPEIAVQVDVHEDKDVAVFVSVLEVTVCADCIRKLNDAAREYGL